MYFKHLEHEPCIVKTYHMCFHDIANADHLHILILSTRLLQSFRSREIVFLDIPDLVSIDDRRWLAPEVEKIIKDSLRGLDHLRGNRSCRVFLVIGLKCCSIGYTLCDSCKDTNKAIRAATDNITIG